MVKRLLKLPKTKSFFLLGPRQTGKSTLIRGQLKKTDLTIDLLEQSEFIQLSRSPERFRTEVLGHLQKHPSSVIFVDEIQKIPALLDEVHSLIESTGAQFILSGSSARKLKRSGTNLLAGRAYSFHLYPLTAEELMTQPQFQLDRYLQFGGLPILWKDEIEDESLFLDSYTQTYLKEEIQSEGIVRKVGPFLRFLDIAAVNDGELVNFSNIARECGVSVKTAQEYYSILTDTFLAYRLDPYTKSLRKRLVQHPKYYFFDPGVTNSLLQRRSGRLNSQDYGRRFEQFVVTQAIALNDYHRLKLDLTFWRTNTGTEVDLLIGEHHKPPKLAVEIKSGPVASPEMRGLMSLDDDFPKIKKMIVVPQGRPRVLENGIHIFPYGDFFEFLKKI